MSSRLISFLTRIFGTVLFPNLIQGLWILTIREHMNVNISGMLSGWTGMRDVPFIYVKMSE